MSKHQTIQKPSEALYKEKGSKFLAFAYPVKDEAEISQLLEELRSKYHDARHHCYAWMLGMSERNWRANDDGEPSHSAGDPILGQIKSFDLTNVLVVVVRYFGGTKLGVGGLIHAYKTAAEEALSKTQKIEIFEMVPIQIHFGYEEMSVAERLISQFEIDVAERDFRESCLIQGKIKANVLNAFREAVASLYNMKFVIDGEGINE
ncbi:MAG: YigZ family protein [Ekhidna sp.]